MRYVKNIILILALAVNVVFGSNGKSFQELPTVEITKVSDNLDDLLTEINNSIKTSNISPSGITIWTQFKGGKLDSLEIFVRPNQHYYFDITPEIASQLIALKRADGAVKYSINIQGFGFDNPGIRYNARIYFDKDTFKCDGISVVQNQPLVEITNLDEEKNSQSTVDLQKVATALTSYLKPRVDGGEIKFSKSGVEYKITSAQANKLVELCAQGTERDPKYAELGSISDRTNQRLLFRCAKKRKDGSMEIDDTTIGSNKVPDFQSSLISIIRDGGDRFLFCYKYSQDWNAGLKRLAAQFTTRVETPTETIKIMLTPALELRIFDLKIKDMGQGKALDIGTFPSDKEKLYNVKLKFITSRQVPQLSVDSITGQM